MKIKSINKIIILGIAIIIMLKPINVHAESPQERWIRIQKESNEEFLRGCEKDGNLTQEAVDALSWGNKKIKPNKKSNVNNNQGNVSSSQNKGYVYGTDELHITGLPTDSETGYTKAGDYGIIEKR